MAVAAAVVAAVPVLDAGQSVVQHRQYGAVVGVGYYLRKFNARAVNVVCERQRSPKKKAPSHSGLRKTHKATPNRSTTSISSLARAWTVAHIGSPGTIGATQPTTPKQKIIRAFFGLDWGHSNLGDFLFRGDAGSHSADVGVAH